MFVILNQQKHYLAKDKNWVDGSDVHCLYRTPHKDAAVNELFEAILREPMLRGEVQNAEVNEHDEPIVEVLNPIETLPEDTVPSDEETITNLAPHPTVTVDQPCTENAA